MPTHTYDELGTFTVTLNVTDNDGLWDTDTTTVQITSEPMPSVRILYPTGGETLKDTIDIEWIAYDTSGGDNVQIIIYLFDSEGDFNRLTPESIENTGSFSWNTKTVADGDYKIQVSAIQGDKSDHDTSEYFTVKNHEDPPENNPPDQPSKPDGPTDGSYNKEYTYSTSVVDVDGDQVYVKWDFDDETSGWLGPYDSGETITSTHLWEEKGTYQIRVIAKDVYGDESGWSEQLSVSMPKYKGNPFFWLFERLMEKFPFIESLLQQYMI